MAKIKAFSQQMIDGMSGQLDFYYWRGQAIVRRWPKTAKQPHSPAQLASRAAFKQCRADLKDMQASVRALWPNDFFGRRQAWLDYYTGMYLRFYKIYGKPPPVVQEIKITTIL